MFRSRGHGCAVIAWSWLCREAVSGCSVLRMLGEIYLAISRFWRMKRRLTMIMPISEYVHEGCFAIRRTSIHRLGRCWDIIESRHLGFRGHRPNRLLRVELLQLYCAGQILHQWCLGSLAECQVEMFLGIHKPVLFEFGFGIVCLHISQLRLAPFSKPINADSTSLSTPVTHASYPSLHVMHRM